MNLFYILFIVFLILITAPLQFVIAVFIVFSSGFPILFKQIRIGRKSTAFTMYKFRTMKNGSELLQWLLESRNEADGPVFKIHNDPRFTPIGKFLSHTGLDELPQLWNVLQGDMALIGPRPLPADEAQKLMPWQKKRHSIKPGIISPWIFEGYHAKPFQTWMKSDIQYAKRKSFRYDFFVAVRFVPYIIQLLMQECFRPLG